ncbi:MAG TPA: NACHT domain-containing protein [Longimicrobium sp.]|nr:NACHT domain-containing protein [Longimicrobium sp.]
MKPLPPWLPAAFTFLSETVVLGPLLKPFKAVADDRDKKRAEEALRQQLGDLLSVAEHTDERVRLLEVFAQVVHANFREILAFLHAQGTEASADELTAFAREMALAAYLNRTAGEHMHADHRGVVDADRDAHAASISLDDVYVPPLLLPARNLASADARERELLQMLLDREAVPAGRREQMETEYAALTGRRWRSEGAPEGALSLARALGPARHAVVIGGPGAGKSTLTRFLARATALGADAMRRRMGWSEPLVPVLIPLALFAEACREQPGLRLRDYVDQRMLDAGGEPLRDAMADALRDGHAWLLLDGVDEVSDYAARVRLVQAVDAFIAHHPEARVLVTSRPYGYIRLYGAVPHFTIFHFTPRQVTRFVVRWHHARERSRNPEAPDRRRAHHQAAALLREIARHPHVSELTANPLMLVIAALVSLDGTRLPQKRVQLYDRVAHTLMDTWNQWRSLLGREVGGVVLPPEQMLRVWGAVAVWTRSEGNTGVVHRAVLERRVAEVLRGLGHADREAGDTARGYLQAAAGQAGILEERGAGIFAFWHPTFEEFLAAVELATPASGIPDRLLPLVDDPRWREVILLAVGYLGVVRQDPDTATEIVLALLDRDPPLLEGLFHGRLLLAAACVADGVRLRRRVMEEVLVRLAGVVQVHPHHVVSHALQLALEAARVADPSPRLVDALLSAGRASGSLQVPIAQFLGAAAGGSVPARDACLALLAEESPWVRTEAAVALARSGDFRREVRQALLNPSTHTAAVPSGLEDFFREVPGELWRGYEDDLAADDPEQRYRAAAVLCDTGRKSPAVLAVLHALAADGPHGVGREAFRRLCAMGDDTPPIRDLLRQQLHSAFAWDRLEAASLLVGADPPDETAVETLKQMVLASREEDRDRTPLYVLQQTGRVDDDLIQALRERMRNGEPGHRMDAAMDLAFLGVIQDDVLDAFRAELHEGAAGGRFVAGQLLLEHGGGAAEDREAVIHAYRELACGDFPAFQQMSAEQLAASRLVDEALLRGMRARLDDPAPRVRLSTAQRLHALDELGADGVRTVEALLACAEGGVAAEACVLLFTADHFGAAARAAALRLLAAESNWHPLREAGVVDALSDAELRPVLIQALQPGATQGITGPLEHLVARRLVDEDVLDLWLRTVGGADDRGAAACLRVLRGQVLGADDVALLVELVRPDPPGAADFGSPAEVRRAARYWLFAWLRRTLAPQQEAG